MAQEIRLQHKLYGAELIELAVMTPVHWSYKLWARNRDLSEFETSISLDSALPS